jgi:glycosyltransferase involved in cell wall biosynthesis
MRILQIHPLMKSEALSPAAGGMARASLTLTRLLVARGHDVQVLPIPEGLGSRELWEVAPGRAVEVAAAMHIPGWKDAMWLPGALLRLRPMPAGIKNIFYDAFALTALRRELFVFRPDIIHNHLARRPFPRLARAVGRHGKMLLTHHHGEMGEDLDAYDRIVFPSRAAQEMIVAQSRYPLEQTRFIYNPVSPEFGQPPAGRENPRRGILFVGAVRVRKGIDLLLEAYQLDRRLRKEPLYIAGAGEDSALVERAIADGLPVVNLGKLAPPEVAAELRSVQLVAIPSRLEGFSIALLEAVCCGAPVVAWAPQVREVESLLGIPVGVPFDGRTQTPAELADGIRAVLSGDLVNSRNRRRMAEAARDAFSEERFVDAYLDVYREMTGS